MTTSATNTICGKKVGTATVLTVTGGTLPYTFKWSNGSTKQTADSLSAGTYTVTVTDAAGCQTITTTPIVVGTSPSITLTTSVNSATCGKNNGSVRLTQTGAVAPFTWTSSVPNRLFDSLPAGNYSYTITDANGCTATTSALSVKDTGSVKAAFAVLPQGCNGDSVRIRFFNNSTGALAGATYTWRFSDNRTSTSTSPEITFSAINGEATLIVRSAFGCSDSLRVTFPTDAFKVDLKDSVATCANTAVTIAPTNGNPNGTVTYRWSTGDSTSTITYRPTTAGRTVITVKITNSLGCVKTDSIIVNSVNKNLDTAKVSFKQDCNTRQITFTNTGSSSDQYRWVFGDPANPTAGSTTSPATYTYPRGGTYTVTLIPRDLACLDTAKFNVTVRDTAAVVVKASRRDTTVCNSDILNLAATSNVANFEWSTNRNFSPVLGTGATLQVRPTVGKTTYYVRSRDAAGCLGLDSINVTNAAISVNHEALVNACKNVGKQIIVSNGNAGDILTVKWTPSSVLTSSDTTLSPTVKVTADGILIGVFKNQFGCSRTDTIQLKSNSVTPTITASAKTIYVDDQLSLSADPKGGNYKYSWTPTATINTPNTATTLASPKEDTRYIVEVTDQFGCKDTASVVVKVLTPQCEEPFVFIPRAFTPNGDGTNDRIFVRGEYLTALEFAIYNRWGERVFYTQDRTQGWDGTYNGKPVCPDVYGFYVKGTCKKGEQFFKKGNITVLK